MKTNISKGKNNGKDCYVLTVHYEDQRRRKFFKTYADAKKFDWVAWLGEKKKVEPMGDQTILSVARDKFLEAYEKRNANPEKTKMVGLETVTARVNQFVRWFGEGRAVSEVTPADFIRYVTTGKCPDGQPWSETTRKNYGTQVKSFMAWCAGMEFGQEKSDWYVQTNPELKWTAEGKVFSKLPGICSVEETKTLLDAIPPKYRPALAIMFFTGIRAEVEMSMLRYSDITWGKRVGLKAERTKTGRERWIKPTENLWAWIPKNGVGAVRPFTYSAFSAARYKASLRAFGDGDYPENGARHSFGSYGYWRSFEWALDTMGHMNSTTFLKNYKNNRVDKEDSEEYFSITP